MEKLLILIGGPNGCGKSSLYEGIRSRKTPLPYLNADLIAVASQGIQGAHGEVNAGRIMLRQLSSAIKEDRSIAIETTMSGRMWVKIINNAKAKGYKITSVFVTIDTVEKSIARIAERKRRGGHAIPDDTVRRRWKRCHYNFLQSYRRISDSWYIFDNSKNGAVLIAQKTSDKFRVFNEGVLKRIEEYGKTAN